MALRASGSSARNALCRRPASHPVSFASSILAIDLLTVAGMVLSVKDLQTMGVTETKLLYTLHWILLFASAECADEEAEAKKADKHPFLFSIPTISVNELLIAKPEQIG